MKLCIRQGDRLRRIVMSPKIEDDGLHIALIALRELNDPRLQGEGFAGRRLKPTETRKGSFGSFLLSRNTQRHGRGTARRAPTILAEKCINPRNRTLTKYGSSTFVDFAGPFFA
jgi:hypothetical protein